MKKTREKLYKKAKFLGGECEGFVYRIGENLVKKIWFDNMFGFYDKEHIIDRLTKTEKFLRNKTPKKFKLAMPEFVGYEIKKSKLITYHEYIKSERVPEKMEKIIREIAGSYINEYLPDMQLDNIWSNPTNTIYSKGKFYLVDAGFNDD